MKTAEYKKEIGRLIGSVICKDLSLMEVASRIEEQCDLIELNALQQGRIEGAKWAADSKRRKEFVLPPVYRKLPDERKNDYEIGWNNGLIDHEQSILSSLDELKEIK